MAKGDVLPSEKTEIKQPETGVRVIQLTSAACKNTAAYYNQEQFIHGSERFVFFSNRTGSGQIYTVEVDSGKIVQLTDHDEEISGFTVDPVRGKVYYGRGGDYYGLDAETLKEEVVAECPEGFRMLAGPDLSACGRYLILSTPYRSHHVEWENMHYRHGSENVLVMVDLFEGKQAIIYHGPTPENRAASDSHVFISRGDPSYVWFGSYSRMQPSGLKTIWYMRVDPETLTPVRDPRPLFNQKPYDYVNHYYSAPNNHVEMYHRLYTATDHEDAPVIGEGSNLAMMLDVDMTSGEMRRWPFPGIPPLHFKCNSVPDMWVGDVADPGFLWFAGHSGTDEDLPVDANYHWPEGRSWIGMFKKRGAYLEVRPLCKHDTVWEDHHPHPVFSPDDRWVAYTAGKGEEAHVYLTEAVWPRWFR